jgi:hypothetical protein
MEAVGRLYSHYSAWEKFVDIAHVLTINEYLIPTNISGIFSTTRIHKSFKNNKHPKTRMYLHILGTRPDGNFGVKNKI